LQAALYLGLRQKEWLFLTSHNYWIVIRLVSGDRPFIAFSPLISINDSSVPFRAFLGALLSVFKGGVVEASTFDDGQTLDAIDDGPSGSNPSLNPDNGSGDHGPPPKRPVAHRPITRSMVKSGGPTLTVRPSCAPFISMASEIHLERFRHLPHCLLNHFKFGSICILSRTTSLVFRQLFIKANNVCG
jgi:hypothetical protein